MNLRFRRHVWSVACLLFVPIALGQAPATERPRTRPQQAETRQPRPSRVRAGSA